ncbi:hypothetical protein [uncultured Campylobacter sp.]|uniref:hypothetical protein n=1 Tax=uncultured Campylobacter sp. TaxID=218934 RepID=UPI002635C52B|nr:hypothetical protein [uncultured Campylobacter sp.]
MAFENAIITKEDDEKYGLSALYGKYNYGAKLPNLNFTIDRQLDCWLLKIYSFPDPNYDRALLAKAIWTMYCDNELLKLTIDYSFDINSTENKFHRIWKLLDLKPNCTANLKLQDILNLLKEMLEAYRDYDAWKPDINYTMELQDLTDCGAK